MNRSQVADMRSWENTSCGRVQAGLYFSKSQAGGDDPHHAVPQPYSMSLTSYSDLVGSWRFARGSTWYSGTARSCGFAPTSSTPGFDQNLVNSALLDLYQRARGSSFYPSLFLAEVQDSVSMIRESATRLAQAYKAARRGDIPRSINCLTGSTHIPQGRVRRFGGDFSRNWLALQWGWIPLVSDIAEGANYIVTKQTPAPKYVRRFVRRLKQVGTVSGTGGGFSAAGEAYRQKQLLLLVRQVNESAPMAPLWDIAQVAWEVTPFSAVVDWLLPLGNYLEARSLAERIDGTLVTTDKAFFKGDVGTSSSYVLGTLRGPVTSVTMTRTVGSVGSSLVFPAVNNGLTKIRSLTGLSLLWQVTR